MSVLKTNSIQPTTPGSEDYFLIKAWVDFNGSTIVIQADGNVSSITDYGVGDYGVAFVNQLLDANYASMGMVNKSDNIRDWTICIQSTDRTAQLTSSLRLYTQHGTAAGDSTVTHVAVVR